MACNVPMSAGRFVMPSAGIPAAIAPEQTSVTVCPAARAATSPSHSFVSAPSSSSPSVLVIDEVPIFTTALMSHPVRAREFVADRPDALGSAPGRSSRGPHLHGLDVLELEPRDAHGVTFARPGACERLLHAHLAEPDVHVLDRLGIGEVGHGDHALRGAPAQPEGTIGIALHRESLLHR